MTRTVVAIVLALATAVAVATTAAERAAAGRALAFATSRGNCLACHVIDGGQQMGDVGPPLAGIAGRFPARDELFRRIWDESAYNPATLMPPFGRHGILTAQEIDLIIDFLYTR